MLKFRNFSFLKFNRSFFLSISLFSFFLVAGLLICLVQARRIHLFSQTQSLGVKSYVRAQDLLSYPRGIFDQELFALKNDNLQIPLPNLSEEIQLIGENDRPDCPPDFHKLLLKVRNSSELKEFQQGSRGYLEFSKENNDTLEFRNSKTPFWIVPLIDDKKIKLLTGVEVSDGLTSSLEETKEFLVEKHPQAFSLHHEKLKDVIDSFCKFQAFGIDQFVKEYGGEQYADLVDCVRLGSLGSQGWDMLFVKPLDTLAFENGQWRLIELGANSRSLPLAQILSFSSDRITIKIWDVTGYHSCVFSLPMYKSTSIDFSFDQIFGRIRQRTIHTVSCKIGSKSCILRKHDWLFHNSSGWRVLDTQEDLQAYLNYKLDGEMLVIDEFYKNKNDSFIIGKLFDKSRSFMKQVNIPFSSNKKTERIAKTKEVKQDIFLDDIEDELDFFDELY